MGIDLLSTIDFPDATEQKTAFATALMMGRAGTIPASAAADQADFLVIVPFNMTLKTVQASALTAPTSSTTVRVRKATPSGGLVTFSDLSATFEATISANQKISALGNPSDVDVAAGDVLNFSITAGGGSGANIMVSVVGTAR